VEIKQHVIDNYWIIEQIKGEIKKKKKNYLEINENRNTAYQNLWDTAKVVQRGRFIRLQAYLKK